MTITWKINNLECQTSDGLVTVVHWGAYATEASNDPDKPYSAGIYSTQALERGDSFVNYDTLTEQTVLGWLWGKIDKATVESALTAQIEAQKAPVTANGLPWGE